MSELDYVIVGACAARCYDSGHGAACSRYHIAQR
jgi:hypothetical protein